MRSRAISQTPSFFRIETLGYRRLREMYPVPPYSRVVAAVENIYATVLEGAIHRQVQRLTGNHVQGRTDFSELPGIATVSARMRALRSQPSSSRFSWSGEAVIQRLPIYR